MESNKMISLLKIFLFLMKSIKKLFFKEFYFYFNDALAQTTEISSQVKYFTRRAIAFTS